MSAHFDYDVFLSHSSKDKPVVRELANRLKQDGLRVWLDEIKQKNQELFEFVHIEFLLYIVRFRKLECTVWQYPL